MNLYSLSHSSFFIGSRARQTFLLLALLALLGTCLYWLSNFRTTSNIAVSKESICILTTVKTGSYEMPAFNTASFRVLSNGLKDTNFKPSCAVGAPLELHYDMTFNAQKTSWQATLKAVDAAGTVIWQGTESAAIQNVGAFQYTTESTAGRLLGQFLATR